MATEKMEFQTEVRDMLNLMINSLYSNKEIFLRELVSNAADALDKRRFLSLSNADLLPVGTQLRIDISVNKEGKRLVVEDNGIGMNKEDLINSTKRQRNRLIRFFCTSCRLLGIPFRFKQQESIPVRRRDLLCKFNARERIQQSRHFLGTRNRQQRRA